MIIIDLECGRRFGRKQFILYLHLRYVCEYPSTFGYLDVKLREKDVGLRFKFTFNWYINCN